MGLFFSMASLHSLLPTKGKRRTTRFFICRTLFLPGSASNASIAASCAFMLPVATPPNAVVFGSGYLNMSDMVGKGIWMNLISTAIVTLFVYFLVPMIWELDKIWCTWRQRARATDNGANPPTRLKKYITTATIGASSGTGPLGHIIRRAGESAVEPRLKRWSNVWVASPRTLGERPKKENTFEVVASISR